MGLRRLLLVPLLLLIIPALHRPAAAQGAACPRFESPRLVLTSTVAPLARDFTRSLPELQSLHAGEASTSSLLKGQAVGLSHSIFGERSQFSTQYAPAPGGICGAVGELTVDLGYLKRVVYVARELPAGSCIQGEVLKHEMVHVAVDETLLREFIPAFRQRLETVLARAAPVRARNRDQLLVMLRQPIETVVKDLVRAFNREREKRQARVDTAEEYRRVSASCNGEIARYVKRGS